MKRERNIEARDNSESRGRCALLSIAVPLPLGIVVAIIAVSNGSLDWFAGLVAGAIVPVPTALALAGASIYRTERKRGLLTVGLIVAVLPVSIGYYLLSTIRIGF